MQTQYRRLFDIYVSEDGVNFTKVHEVKTDLIPLGEYDKLVKYDIPEGTYKAIKIECHGGENMDGSYYSWNSFLEVQFDMVNANNPNDTTTVNPNFQDGENSSTEPSQPVDATQPSDGQGSDDDKANDNAGTIILIVCLAAAAVVAGGVAAFLIIRKKKAAQLIQQAEDPQDNEQ